MNKAIKQSFFNSNEFAALNALHNLFQHHQGLLEQVKTIPILPEMPLYSDLMTMCLVPKEVVERAINGERQYVNKPKIRSALKWYGGLVNLNPALFNFAVIVFEKCIEAKIIVDDAAWGRFAEVYNTESKSNQTHFVNGDIVCRSADVDAILNSIYVKH
ncbi:MAG: hypothetical protein COA52_13320 [Hyphomicrobiales bacterium]|nr:MAG: hypothetical protein COA52_13320 [Hyphomicrobiales bacterium]